MDDGEEFRKNVGEMIRWRAERLAGLERDDAGDRRIAGGVFGVITAGAAVAGVSASGFPAALLLCAAWIAGVLAVGFSLKPGIRTSEIARRRRALHYLEEVRRTSVGRSAADAKLVGEFVQAVESFDGYEKRRREDRSVVAPWMVLTAMTGAAAVTGTGGFYGVMALAMCAYSSGYPSARAVYDRFSSLRSKEADRRRRVIRKAHGKLPEELKPILDEDRPERFAPLSIQADRAAGGYEPVSEEEAAHRGGHVSAVGPPEARGGFEPPPEPSEKVGAVGGYVLADPDGHDGAVGRVNGPAPGVVHPLGSAESVRGAVGPKKPERAPTRGGPKKPRKPRKLRKGRGRS